MEIDTAVENQNWGYILPSDAMKISKDSFTAFQLPLMGHCDWTQCVDGLEYMD